MSLRAVRRADRENRHVMKIMSVLSCGVGAGHGDHGYPQEAVETSVIMAAGPRRRLRLCSHVRRWFSPGAP